MENQIAKLEPVTVRELSNYLDAMGLAPLLTDKEKAQFLEISQAFGLNPFKREIYCSKYGNQMSIIVGYETYIKRAERSGQLDGWQVITEGKVDDDSLKAIITIHRKDRKIPFVHEVYYSEYVQKTKEGQVTKFWTKAYTMIKKVAMAQGFRLCFSDELGGMPYSKEEMPEQTEDVSYTEVVAELPQKTPYPFMTPEEKIEDAKAVLIVATKENFGTLWKSLNDEMKADETVIAFGKELSEKLGVKSKKQAAL